MTEPERFEGAIFPPPLLCPFCGEEPAYGTSENGKIVDFISCGDCGVGFSNERMACPECGEAVDDPLAAWQRRTPLERDRPNREAASHGPSVALEVSPFPYERRPGLSPTARTEIERVVAEMRDHVESEWKGTDPDNFWVRITHVRAWLAALDSALGKP